MTDGAPDPKEPSEARIKPTQDPLVERFRPDPAKPPEPALTLSGFLGNSDRAGSRRLYFGESLDYYAEFREDDVLHSASIPANEQPFLGEEATRVALGRDATVEYTRTGFARPPDGFDRGVTSDILLGAFGI